MKIQRANIHGQILKWARESMNLAAEEAAKRIGVPCSRLESWERDEAKPTVRQAREASRIYKRPLAVFFLREPPRDFHVPHDFRRVPGEVVAELPPEFIAALRTAQYRRRLAISLAEAQPKDSYPFLGSASLTGDKDSLVPEIRTLLGVSLEQQKSWTNVYEALNGWKEGLERQGILVFHFAGVETEDVRAFSICDEPFPVISVNGKDSPTGRVFSLLHEFSHLLLDEGGSCDLREQQNIHSHDQKVEAFCNYLSGAVLVPKADLLKHAALRNATAQTRWDDAPLTDLAREYRVSTQVILRRLLLLGKTNRAFFEQKQLELATASRRETPGGFLTVPRRVVREVGQPFVRIILGAYSRNAITTADVAEYFGMRIKHLPAVQSLLAGRNVLTGGDL